MSGNKVKHGMVEKTILLDKPKICISGMETRRCCRLTDHMEVYATQISPEGDEDA